MKKILDYVIFGVLCFWQFPQLLVAIVMLPFLGKITKVAYRHYNFCFIGSKLPKGAGISLGPLCFICESHENSKENIAHELDGHTVDSKIFGPLYLLVIGLPSIMNAVLGFTKCYYDFYTERWANKHAGLTTTDYCRLKFINKEETQA